MRLYQEFLARYDRPNARLQPLVEDARAALAQLPRQERVERSPKPKP